MTKSPPKSEQWYINELVDKINNNEVTKPKFQRKKKWNIQPNSKKSLANEREYIDFLFKVQHSVEPITFGVKYVDNKKKYSNINGNNRINAICNFINNPFNIYPEYIYDLKNFISKLDILTSEEMELIIDYFEKINYNDVIIISRLDRHFEKTDLYEIYDTKLKTYSYDMLDLIEIIQKKLKLNNNPCDRIIKISVTLFEGFSTTELSEVFSDINKYNNKLTETEILSCKLYDITDFNINDNIINTKLINHITEYYNEKSKDEILSCYKFGKNDKINAYDFIVGMEKMCYYDYKITDDFTPEGLSLFFKLYKLLNGNLEDESFKSKNINEFVDNILFSFRTLDKIYKKIFTEKLNTKLFNKACEIKLHTIKKNNMFCLISSIIGFKRKNVSEDVIIKSIEKCLLCHFFIRDLNDKELKKSYIALYDTLLTTYGESLIWAYAVKLIKNPEEISNKITEDFINKLINTLIIQSNTPLETKPKNVKRRKRKFFEKCLFFYYYKNKVPVNLLENNFSLEHIIVFSSSWNYKIDIDRLGNLVPILHNLNNTRGKRHIDIYEKIDKENFMKYIEDVIPENEKYNEIVKHTKKNSVITDNEKYNELCQQNEKIYLKNFISCLF